MIVALFAIALGLVLLFWSADRFVGGAVDIACHYRLPQLLIGMLIVGFGTSAPEMFVSALSAIQGNSGIAIGNAYGSNIANIALILGITAFIQPIVVCSEILRKQIPILALVTIVAGWQMLDYSISLLDAILLLVLFAGIVCWNMRQSKKTPLVPEKSDLLDASPGKIMIKKAIFWLIAGLAILVMSSQLLVWGAVKVATILGVADTIIGLTIVALGTSLPELASSICAARKGSPDIALGNILGSNLFNTLAVVGIAGLIHPFKVSAEVLSRDMLIMGILTFSLFLFGYGFGKGRGVIGRTAGTLLILVYLGYITYLLSTVIR